MLETVARELRELRIEARVVSWHGAGEAGVVFQLPAPSGRLKDQTLQIGLSFQEAAYPEYPPHFIHFRQEEVEGTNFTRHSEHRFEGAQWWAFSFPPRDFLGRLGSRAEEHAHLCQAPSVPRTGATVSFEAALVEPVHGAACDHLLAHLRSGKRQEDLCFALWRPSRGACRTTALISELLLPEKGERTLHGGASFEADYLSRGRSPGLREERRVGPSCTATRRQAGRE